MPSWTQSVGPPSYGGGLFLVGYSEHVAAPDDATQVFVGRITPAGELLDPHGIRIATSGPDPWEIAVPTTIFVGTSWLVVWTVEYRTFMPGSIDPNPRSCQTFCARVAADGTVLDPEGKLLFDDLVDARQSWRLAFNGTQVLAATAGVAAMLGTDCTLLGEPFTIPADATLKIAASDRDFVATYVEWMGDADDALYSQRVSPSGALGDKQLVASDPSVLPPDVGLGVRGNVAFDGQQFVIPYAVRSAQQLRMRTQTLGGVLGPERVLANSWTAIPDNLVVVDDGFVVLGPPFVKVTQSAVTQVDWTSTIAQTLQTATSRLAAGGGTLLLASPLSVPTRTIDAHEMTFTRFGPELVPLGPPSSLSTVVEPEIRPAVANNGDVYLVSWEQGRADELACARVSRSGEVLDPSPVVFGVRAAILAAVEPPSALASNGRDFMNAWIGDGYAVLTRRVTADGAMPDAAPIVAVAPLPFGLLRKDLAIASNGQDYLITFRESGADQLRIQGVRVSADGVTPAEAPFTIGTLNGVEAPPRIVYDGEQYVVAYDLTAYPAQPLSEIVRVTADGTVSSRTEVPFSVASLAGSPQNALVVWVVDLATVLASRVDRSGVLLEPEGVRLGGSGPTLYSAGDHRPPLAEWDGTNYWVSWRAVTDCTLGCTLGEANATFIHAVRVTPSGEVLDTEELRLGLGPVPPALYVSGVHSMLGSQTLLAYSEWDNCVGVRSDQMRARLLGDMAGGGAAGGGAAGSDGHAGCGAGPSGSGGSAGSAGSGAGAGAPGSGGAAGDGTSMGGRSSGGDGGAAAGGAIGGTAGTTSGDDGTEGCSCRIAGAGGAGSARHGWLALLLLLARPRRRRASAWARPSPVR